MRRKADTLLPIEKKILATGFELAKRGVVEFHGFGVAKEMKERAEARLLTAYGTLYKALERLEEFGLLESRLEDPLVAELDSNRPRRRLYHLTAAGARAAVQEPDSASRSIKLSMRPVQP